MASSGIDLLSADDTIKAAAIVMRLGDHDPTASEPSSVPRVSLAVPSTVWLMAHQVAGDLARAQSV